MDRSLTGEDFALLAQLKASQARTSPTRAVSGKAATEGHGWAPLPGWVAITIREQAAFLGLDSAEVEALLDRISGPAVEQQTRGMVAA